MDSFTNRLLLLGALSYALYGTTLGDHLKESPQCAVSVLDGCGKAFIPYADSTRMAETEEELKEQCALHFKQLRCTRNFTTECAIGLPRVAAVLALDAADENIEAVCTPGTELNQMYNNTIRCINKVGVQMNRCIRDLVVDLSTAVAKAPLESQVAYGCCYYYDLLGCYDRALVGCNRTDAPRLAATLAENVFGQTLGLVCGVYTKGSPACEALPPLQRLDPSELNTDNFIVPLVTLASTLKHSKVVRRQLL
ncbi:hypothetical protein V5799_019141 [Amblyomma americanum]|uniref:Secreted protein n=1 Tax=Amblyomma americanum TaxID=6943 RepID=A0AAQ4EXQ3_AMBAM